MFIDKATLIIGILCICGWLLANAIVVCNYSIKFMKEEFWDNQNIFGKLCSNVFYAPAWLVMWVRTALVCVAFWFFVIWYKVFRYFARIHKTAYSKAIKLEL